MKGYIKDYRKELESDIWVMPPLYHRVWQYLKYKANHKENKIPMRDGTFLTIKPGQHLTSIRKIANDVGWYERGVFKTPNPKTVSSILEWLEKQEMISIDRGKGNRQYTLITLLNWGLYQSNDNESNSKETVSKQSVDINNNDKNDKNEKNINNKRHKYEICDMRLAELLYQEILKNNPNHKKPNLEKWANDIRLMRERDERTEEQIEYLILWTQQHEFWHTNILSPSKLRKQWDRLVLQVKQEKNKKSNVTPITKARKKDKYNYNLGF